ncbi:MAG: class I SAM-dependent methyltransferase [Eubacteriaceae bacterium]|nr:class I SAM-dependent methyltransferase [Eubacteriaceae bacterium]
MSHLDFEDEISEITAFDDFAVYYDILAADADYKAWFSYLKSLSGLEKLKNAKVLDLGCGSGVMAALFAGEGAVVTGVDFSSEMLTLSERALRNVTNRFRLIKNDIRDFRENVIYDFAYSSCDVINNISPSDLPDVFANISHMLRSKGNFTFDVINPDRFSSEENRNESIILDGGETVSITRSCEGGRLMTRIDIPGREMVTIGQYPISQEIIESSLVGSAMILKRFTGFMCEESYSWSTDKYQVILEKE